MDKQFNTLSTKERIIKVTMNIIIAEGFQNVTIRKIATQAGVNIAAINYHFGSKDAVINEALKKVTIPLKNAFTWLKQSDLKPQAKLELFIKEYADVLFKYPDIIKIIIDQNIHNYPAKVEAGYQEYLKDEGIELIINVFEQLNPGQSKMINEMRALHLLSSLAFPILMGDKISEMIAVDLRKPEIRQKYTELLLNSIS